MKPPAFVGERVAGAAEDAVNDGDVVGEATGAFPRRPRFLADCVVIPIEDAGADPEVQPSTGEVVDGQGLACEGGGWPQDRIADKRADADAVGGVGGDRQQAPTVEPGSAAITEVGTVVGNEYLVETEVLQPAEHARVLDEAGVGVDQDAKFQFLSFGHDYRCNCRLGRSIPSTP